MTTRTVNSGRRSAHWPLALVAVGASMLAGCAGSSLPELPKISELNPFKEDEKRLPGKRVPVMPTSSGVGAELAPATEPIQLPAAALNTDWTQPGGIAANAPGHLVYNGAGRRVWSTDVGTGSTGRSRLTASPVVYGNRVFTLDAQTRVASVSTQNGGVAWRTQLVPENENAGEGYGGGLAVMDGRLYVATGFGWVYGLDAASGKQLWSINVGRPVRASPTVANGVVFVIGTDGRVLALNTTDGTELWSYRGLPQSQALIANPSPAVSGNTVVVPYPSGEIIAINISDGVPAWSDSLASTSTGAIGAMTDASRPVIVDGVVYAVGHSGRMLANGLETGERRWSAKVPGMQAPVVSGDTAFVVDIRGALMALEADGGRVRWTMKMPEAKVWSGPVLASGKLWLTSSRGHLASVDAQTGKLLTNRRVADKFYIAPVIAAGRMYVLSDDAQLMAFD